MLLSGRTAGPEAGGQGDQGVGAASASLMIVEIGCPTRVRATAGLRWARSHYHMPMVEVTTLTLSK